MKQMPSERHFKRHFYNKALS
ncbi:hypothetical protein ESCNG_120003 [Neisseria gonorrhoeae]|uniref:Uncharacterized protein n=1 Tax=Neisseria gonorrhoeae TaxID=485 RepID=A0AB74EPZ5_NEIGO|nr:hypothetical protein ESCNG_120003 [Neisseria gonorrhoeae]SCW12473.1 hypothetical protein ESCNG_250002 [Neisseria gonorrhoeae]